MCFVRLCRMKSKKHEWIYFLRCACFLNVLFKNPENISISTYFRHWFYSCKRFLIAEYIKLKLKTESSFWITSCNNWWLIKLTVYSYWNTCIPIVLCLHSHVEFRSMWRFVKTFSATLESTRSDCFVKKLSKRMKSFEIIN